MSKQDEASRSFRDYLDDVMREAGACFGQSLMATEYPNGDRDAPAHEHNLTVHIAHQLLSRPYHQANWAVYVEAVLAPRRRVDLVACCGEVALALECKTFGNVDEQAASALKDWQRLQSFRPSLSRPSGDRKRSEWWSGARERWTAIAICTFRDLGDDWVRTRPSTAQAIRPASWGRLLATTQDAVRNEHPICADQYWRDTASARLLYAAAQQPTPSLQP